LEVHVNRAIALLGAPSNIGIRPYDDGRLRGLDRAPAALRARGLAARLHADDVGNVVPPEYVDFTRPAGRVRNESALVGYSRDIGARVAHAVSDGRFVLLLGGDCSIVLGGLLGARTASTSRLGLVYVDGHADFATPEESVTGSAASMCAAFAVGRGDSALAQLADIPLVTGSDLAILGRRDDADGNIYGQAALHGAGALDIPALAVRSRGTAAAAAATLERLSDVSRIWIHVDADVLDPSVMPAVDSPEPSGLTVDELVSLLRPLVRDSRAVGLELTIYDPNLDSHGTCAETLVSVLERTFVGSDQ
jgi:arginase